MAPPKRQPKGAKEGKDVNKKTVTEMIAPSDYEHIFHQKPSTEVLQTGRELAHGLIAPPSAYEAEKDALATKGEDLLPEKVYDMMFQFIESVPKKYSLKPSNSSSSSSSS